MTMKTSLIITGDSAVAQKEVDALKASLDRLGGATKGAIAPANDLGRAQADVARGAINVSASTTGAASASRAMSVAQGAVAQSSEAATRQMSGAVTMSGRMTASFGQLGNQANVLAGQIRSVEVGFGGMGGAIVQAEAKQSLFKQGMSLLGGVVSGFVGGAIAGLIDSLGRVAIEYLSGADAADEARRAGIDYANSQSDIARLVDLATGRIIVQNGVLRENAILKRQDAIFEAGKRIADVRSEIQGKIAARADPTAHGSWLQIFGGAAAGVSVTDPDLQKIVKAGGGIRQFDQALAELIKRRPELRGLRVEVNGLGAEAEKLFARMQQDQAELGLLQGGVGALDRYNKLTGGGSPLATGGGTGGRSRSSTAAAIRDTGAASREASAALADLTKDLQGVVSRYDPARKAAADYADELDRISRLAAAYDPTKGVGLSAEDAERYRAAAFGAYQRKRADAFDLPAVEDIRAVEGAVEAAGDAYDGLSDAAREAAMAQQQLQNMAMGALDAIIVGGEKAGDVVKRLGGAIASAALEATLFGTGPLAALLGGAGAAGRTGAAGAATPIAAGAASKAAAETIADAIGKRMDGVFGSGGGFAVTLRNAGLGYAAGGATGSPLGGAIGGVVGGKLGEKYLSGALGKLGIGDLAGPLGSIAVGLIGGVIGKLFAPKAQPGGATVSAVNGQAAMSGTVGSDKGGIQAGSGMAGSVAQTINQIASQLGGGVGNFSVQIGTYKDAIRVNVNGRPLGGVTGSGAVGFGSDENAAINYAAAQAIAQGAITGVSEQVAKALRSSSDVEASLKEALKVQQIEVLMGGIGGQIEKAFKDFEATAKERVRIAQQYGFDVVAIEKRNAEDRAKLAQELLQGQVGSLKRLVEEMTHGSLFEGSAIDRIAALKGEIDKAKADLDAGIEGAGDTLAGLYEQLNAASKAAYGSTSGYAADRSMILDDARAAIARANQQITDAQAKSDPALATTNAALDENNDQNAEMLAELREQNELLRQMVAAGGGYSAYDLNDAARV